MVEFRLLKAAENVLVLPLFTNFILLFINQKWFYFFFSSSDMHKFHHLVECYVTDINSLLIFLHALSFLNLLRQAISLRTFLIKIIIIKVNIVRVYITRFLSLISIKWQVHQLYPESYSIQEQILMHEHNYQQLYCTFLNFCSR